MALNKRTALGLTCLSVAAAAAPLLDRLYLRVHDAEALSSQDLMGIISDLGVSLVVASLLISLIARLRLAAVAVVFLWSLLNYASFEHIRELGTGLQFTFASYAVDRTFVTGSMLTLASPALLAVTLGASIVSSRPFPT